MAKVCRNCGKKIGFKEPDFHLWNAQEYFCTDCGGRIMPMFEELKNTVDFESFRTKSVEFAEFLENSRLSESSKKSIAYELRLLSNKKIKKSDVDYTECMSFEADFQTAYDMIEQCGEDEPFFPPRIIEIGNTKNAVFTYDVYTNNGCYPHMMVNLVHACGRAYVSVLGRPTSLFSDNVWTAESNDVKKFWGRMFTQNPDMNFEHYPVRTMEQLSSRAIGVLGGTFDPVHNGHKTLAKAALEQGNLKKLIVMPAHVQPFKLGKEISDDSHRLDMVKLAFEDMPEVEVSDYEIKHTEISYTYETLCKLQEIYPDDELAFIMGTDSFLNLDTWYMGRELLEKFSFLVSVRPGYRESELEQKIEEFRRLYHTKVEKLVMEMPDISSTEIRTKYEMGISIKEDVPETVERYIHEHRLYK